MVEKSLNQNQRERINKDLYKLEIKLLKILPLVLAIIHMVNIFTSYFSIDLPILSYIGGVSFIPLTFMYLSSYVFNFCEHHRMFLHYVVLDNIICIYDLYIGIPISALSLFKVHIVLLGVFLFLILYLHQKSRKNEKSYNNNT